MENVSQPIWKPPQQNPPIDNLAKTEFHNLTHNKHSETLVRDGMSSNTMPKPGQTRKKQNRNSYHPRAAKCTLSSMFQACRSPKKWCHWQMMLNDCTDPRNALWSIPHAMCWCLRSLRKMVTHKLVLPACTAMKQRRTMRTPLQTTHQNTFATRRANCLPIWICNSFFDPSETSSS